MGDRLGFNGEADFSDGGSGWQSVLRIKVFGQDFEKRNGASCESGEWREV